MVAKSECSDGVREFTIRHVCCELILASEGKDWCPHCTHYRQTLLVLARQTKSLLDKTLERTDPSSHTNYRFLTTAEKSQRLQRIHHQHHLTQKKNCHVCKKNYVMLLTSKLFLLMKIQMVMYERWCQRRKRYVRQLPRRFIPAPFLGRAEESSSQERSPWHTLASAEDYILSLPQTSIW